MFAASTDASFLWNHMKHRKNHVFRLQTSTLVDDSIAIFLFLKRSVWPEFTLRHEMFLGKIKNMGKIWKNIQMIERNFYAGGRWLFSFIYIQIQKEISVMQF